MDGDEPGTPEWWPENPWAHEAPKMPGFQPAPSNELVPNTVQDIFKTAKKRALEIHQARAKHSVTTSLNQMIAEKRAEQGFKTIRLQFASGGQISVSLTDTCCYLHEVQNQTLDLRLRRIKVQLTIPGSPRPLPPDTDLRNLVPEHPVLEVWVLH